MYIINFAKIAYHPSENEYISLSGEYIIKSQRNTPSVMIYTLKRDDIRLAAMIYQVCDLDKKILQKMYPFLQYFFGAGGNIRHRRNRTWFATANIKDWSHVPKNKKDA